MSEPESRRRREGERGRMRRKLELEFHGKVTQKKKKKTYLPSNLCFKKSNSAFCIMSVTYRRERQETAVRQGDKQPEAEINSDCSPTS